MRALAALTVCAALAFAAGCGDDDDSDDGGEAGESGVTALSIETCGELEYGGDGEPELLIVSDLPLSGDSSERSNQMNDAIRYELDLAGWTAGDHAVAFQACDDSLESTGAWDVETCRTNAEAYAANEAVIGVIGTYNSGCAAEIIPVLNEAGVAMVSPGNTAVCLTEESVDCEDGQPDSLYPGERNYARVVPNDADQGAGLAQFALDNGIKTATVLYAADDPTSSGQATSFERAADDLGINVADSLEWDPEAGDYGTLMKDVAKTNPDAVVLAGLLEQNGKEIIEAKVSELGPNDGDVDLLAFDGFAQQATIDQAGTASTGMYASIPGRDPSGLTGAGADLVADLAESADGPVELYAPYAGAASQLLLDAIELGNAERSAVASSLFGLALDDSVIGPIEIGDSGDPVLRPITILKAADEFEVETEVDPSDELVAAVRG